MDSLKQWALCLIVGALAGTVVTALSPRGATSKTVRAVAGIFIVAVIGVPFTDMLEGSYSAEAFAAYDYDYGDADMSDFLLESFCESVKKELETAALQAEIPFEEIFIEADIDTENCIIIHNITVRVGSDFSDKSAELSDILSKSAGVYVTVIAE